MSFIAEVLGAIDGSRQHRGARLTLINATRYLIRLSNTLGVLAYRDYSASWHIMNNAWDMLDDFEQEIFPGCE